MRSVWETIVYDLNTYFVKIIYPAIGATLRMLISCMVLICIFGFLLGVVLVLYNPLGLHPHKIRYNVINFIVNAIYSFPAIILIVSILPITHLVMGTTLGEKAAIFPLTIAGIPYMARMVENTFLGVNKQLIEAARSFGASNTQIIFEVMVKESVPSLISIISVTSVSQLAGTTLAGAVGGGGLGAVALNYGFYSFNKTVLYTCVAILLIMVFAIQGIGNFLYKKLQ